MLGFIALLGIGAYAALDSMSNNKRMNDKCNEMSRQGGFLPYMEPDKRSMIWQDLYYDWNDEKKSFPKEYHAYLSRNKNALSDYITSLMSAEEIKKGFQPTICWAGLYNKFEYDPFRRFNSMYREKIKIFNETGKYYY